MLLKLWYPAPFFSISGGWQGLKIVALIDLVLGPLLTFIVYNRNKQTSELKRDLGVIICLQIAVLSWGVVTIYEQRPTAVAFWEGRFYTVPASAIKAQGLELEVLDNFGTDNPKYIYIQRPLTQEEWQPVLEKIQRHNIPPHHQVELYRPIKNHFNDIYKHQLNIDKIISSNQETNKQINKILVKSKTSLHDNKYIAMESKYSNIILVYNNQNLLIGTATFASKQS